jgi:formylglycine-generating enzyme required for sulfatase activity
VGKVHLAASGAKYWFTIMPLVLKRTKHSVKFFVEKLSSEVNLKMMLIPAGTFLMGSPENEIDRQSNESPQQQFQIQILTMGQGEQENRET